MRRPKQLPCLRQSIRGERAARESSLLEICREVLLSFRLSVRKIMELRKEPQERGGKKNSYRVICTGLRIVHVPTGTG